MFVLEYSDFAVIQSLASQPNEFGASTYPATARHEYLPRDPSLVYVESENVIYMSWNGLGP